MWGKNEKVPHVTYLFTIGVVKPGKLHYTRPMNENTENLHAHVETSMTDCDGRMDRDWVAQMNDEELASEFGDLDFKSRMLSNLVSWSYQNTVTIEGVETGHGETIEVSYAHDEGRFWGRAVLCTDECDESAHGQRDHAAEAMGY